MSLKEIELIKKDLKIEKVKLAPVIGQKESEHTIFHKEELLIIGLI